MNRRLLAILLCLAALVGACSADGDDVASSDEPTTEEPDAGDPGAEDDTTEPDGEDGTAEPSSDVEAIADTIEVELIDSGTEPRRLLRYTAPVGTVDRVTQVQAQAITQRIDGQVQELPVPGTEADLVATVESVDGEERTTSNRFEAFRVVVGDGPGAQEAAEETQRIFDQLAGLVQTTVTTDRGVLVDSDIADAAVTGNPVFDSFATSLGEQAQSLSFPFPEAEVGVGAVWEVRSRLELSGLAAESTYRITIDSIDGEVVSATTETEVRFVPGEVELQGIRATVVSGTLTGGGPVRWDLAGQLLPRTELVAAGTVVIEAQGVRLEQDQEQRTTVADAAT